MKKYIILIVAVAMSTLSQAQRIAIVDVNAVLEGLADYKAAQIEVDKVAAEWQQEIAQEYDKIKSMYNKYQAEQVLLSDDAKKAKEDQIIQKEETVRDLQKRRFGPDGDLFKKRQQMVSPIQDKVFTALESFAADRGFDLIFDKSSTAGLLFVGKDFDKTDEIKKLVGSK